MRGLISRLREDLWVASDRLPALSVIIAVCLFIAPMAMLWRGAVDVFVSVAAATFLLRSLVERDFQWLRELWVIVALVLWGYLIARGLLSIDPERSSIKALSWIRFVILGCAIQFILTRSEAARALLLFSILAMLIFGAGDAIFQFVVGHDIFGMPMHGGNRLTGPSQRPAIGFVLVIVGMPALAYLLRELGAAKTLVQGCAYAAAIALVVSAVFLSGERLAFLQLVAATALLTIFMRVPVQLFAAVSALAVSLAIGLALTSGAAIKDRQLSTFTEVSKGGGSIYLRAMQSGVEVIKDHPIFGVGLKNFKANCPASAADDETKSACFLIHPHQIWIHIAAETGFVGLAGFLTIFILLLGSALRAFWDWAEQPLLAGAALSTIFLLLPFVPSGNFFSNFRESVFWFMLGTAAAMGRIVLARKSGHVCAV